MRLLAPVVAAANGTSGCVASAPPAARSSETRPPGQPCSCPAAIPGGPSPVTARPAGRRRAREDAPPAPRQPGFRRRKYLQACHSVLSGTFVLRQDRPEGVGVET